MGDELGKIRRHFVESVDSLVALRDAHAADLAALRAENERLRAALGTLVEYIDNREGRVFVGAPALASARAALEADQ